MGNPRLMERVLGKFQDRFRSDLSELARGVENGDWAVVTSVAHRIKGASANVSALEIMNLASEVEELSRAEEVLEIPPRMERMYAAWRRFVDRVSTLHGSQPRCHEDLAHKSE